MVHVPYLICCHSKSPREIKNFCKKPLVDLLSLIVVFLHLIVAEELRLHRPRQNSNSYLPNRAQDCALRLVTTIPDYRSELTWTLHSGPGLKPILRPSIHQR